MQSHCGGLTFPGNRGEESVWLEYGSDDIRPFGIIPPKGATNRQLVATSRELGLLRFRHSLLFLVPQAVGSWTRPPR